MCPTARFSPIIRSCVNVQFQSITCITSALRCKLLEAQGKSDWSQFYTMVEGLSTACQDAVLTDKVHIITGHEGPERE